MVEDPIEEADNTEAFSSDPKIVEAGELMASTGEAALDE